MGRKRGLGKGLDALLGSVPEVISDGALRQVPVHLITPGPHQPRGEIDEVSLEELAASIRAQGVMQPIVVRRRGEGYEIIAGERRWRACQLAGVDRIPVIVREASDESAIAMALIENLQREDLSPVEEARAFARLRDEFDLTHERLAEVVGKSRASVTNALRLLNLADRVLALLEDGSLEMGHARALLSLAPEQQGQAAREVVRRGLSVRQTEALVQRMQRGPLDAPTGARRDPDIQRLEHELADRLGAPVNIRHSARGSGRVVIRYGSLEDLDGVLAHIK